MGCFKHMWVTLCYAAHCDQDSTKAAKMEEEYCRMVHLQVDSSADPSSVGAQFSLAGLGKQSFRGGVKMKDEHIVTGKSVTYCIFFHQPNTFPRLWRWRCRVFNLEEVRNPMSGEIWRAFSPHRSCPGFPH